MGVPACGRSASFPSKIAIRAVEMKISQFPHIPLFPLPPRLCAPLTRFRPSPFLISLCLFNCELLLAPSPPRSLRPPSTSPPGAARQHLSAQRIVDNKNYFICPSLSGGEQGKIGTFEQAVSNKLSLAERG
jgi:hypothetical protein